MSLVLKDNISVLASTNTDLSNLDGSIELKENISAPIAEGETLGKLTYTIDGIDYSSDLVASHNVEPYEFPVIILQSGAAVLVLIVLLLVVSKKNKKKKKYKNYDSIYKFK